jgi:hypothetical protein
MCNQKVMASEPQASMIGCKNGRQKGSRGLIQPLERSGLVVFSPNRLGNARAPRRREKASIRWAVPDPISQIWWIDCPVGAGAHGATEPPCLARQKKNPRNAGVK